MFETSSESGSRTRPNFIPVEVYEIGGYGQPGQLIIHNGKLFIYNAAGETLIDGGVIQTRAIAADAITADKIDVANLAAINADIGSITAGSMAGVTLSIGSDNNIFKATADGISLGNATFASAPFRVDMLGHVTASDLTLTNAGIGAGSSWTGNQITNTYIGNLNADKITAGDIATDRMKTNALSALQADVEELSAITANIGTITAGSITGVTITGSTLQTAVSGLRVVIDSNNKIKFYDG